MSDSTGTSEPASGNATPGPTSKPKKSKNLLIMVAAIIVAVILIAVVFLAVDWDGDGTTQGDLDEDGIPDDEDDDIDGDGIANDDDTYPRDMDNDGTPDEEDDDIDGDGIPNDEDENPREYDEPEPEPEPTYVYEVEATADPAGPVTLEAGEAMELSVTSVLRNINTSAEVSYDGESNVSYRWGRTPLSLGTFNDSSAWIVEFTAGDAAGTGSVYCNVTYDDEELFDVVTVAVTVNEPFLVSVSITPGSATLLVGEETEVFTATAYNSVSDPMTEGVTFEWAVTGLDAGDYTLNSTTGYMVEFTPLEMPAGSVSLDVVATSGVLEATDSAAITVTDVPEPERVLDYYVYDMFEVPFGEWYEWRAPDEEVWSFDGPPYIYNWTGSEIGNLWFYTMMRMDITGSYMDEINMNSNPVFLPKLGTTSGGNAVIDWYLQYMTYAEASEWPNVKAWYDGWEVVLNGTTTLDFEAAQSVIGMPAAQWDTFDTWWADAQDGVISGWNDFLEVQANQIYDIWCMYEWPLQVMVIEIDAEKVGDNVVLTHRTVSWGMEALMSRWLRATFMDDHEPYFDDFSMYAEIGPETTNLSISTAVQYSCYAYATTDEGLDCWMWEALKGDYMLTEDAVDDDWISEYDVYADKTYLNLAPGSPLYGTDMIYDYVPGALNLSEGETLTFEWPSGDQVFVHHIAPGEYELVEGPMTVDYAEPMGVDFPGQVTINAGDRTIMYEGPIDMWTWSRDQDRAVNLADEWDRIGLLPYGMPTIEFRLDSTAMMAGDGLTAPAPALAMEAAIPVPASAVPESAAGVSSAASEVASLACVAVAAFMLLLALGMCARRPGRRP